MKVKFEKRQSSGSLCYRIDRYERCSCQADLYDCSTSSRLSLPHFFNQCLFLSDSLIANEQLNKDRIGNIKVKDGKWEI